jgi:hypothetical protein
MFIPDPGSKTATKERGETKFVDVITLTVATNFTKLQIILPKKLSISSRKYGFGIRDPEKTYSGSRIQGSKRHRIPDPQHCYQCCGSGMFIPDPNFSIPNPGSKIFRIPDLDPHQRI